MVAEPGKLVSRKEKLRIFFEVVFRFDAVAKQEKMKVLEVGNLALFISKWQLVTKRTDSNPVSREFIATSVFRKSSEGKWRLVIDNSFGPAIL